jgi:hypothetical protein
MHAFRGNDESQTARGLMTSVNATFLKWWCADDPRLLQERLALSRVAFGPEDLARLAKLPFLLPDLGFDDEDSWVAWVGQSALVCEVRPLCDTAAARLTRHVLTLAWHLARGDGRATLMLCGICSTIAKSLAQLQLHQLDELVVRTAPRLQLRWHGQANYWIRMFDAVRNDNSREIDRLSLLGLQMLCTPHASFVSHSSQ